MEWIKNIAFEQLNFTQDSIELELEL